MNKGKKIKAFGLLLSLLMLFSFSSCQETVNNIRDTINETFSSSAYSEEQESSDKKQSSVKASEAPSQVSQSSMFTLDSIPEYSGISYVEINGNVPYFDSADYTETAFESYSELDSLGRCGVAYANVCRETMPTEKRGDISSVKPTGWHSIRYDFVDGQSLYNRCHLIGYQLTAENANSKNLVTGTRYLNVDGMLPFENMIADYVKETNNHVLYRVTPVFVGDELVCRGVEMEAYSVEDSGDGVSFNVYAYNVQPGVVINYTTGYARLADDPKSTTEKEKTYVINLRNKKVHLPECSSVAAISENNKKTVKSTLFSLLNQGYTACGTCLG